MNKTNLKPIILCADDFGLTPVISEGILSLLEKERINATSCITASTYWQENALALKPYIGKAFLGLHLNLTEGNSLSGNSELIFQSIGKILIYSHLRALSLKAIKKEFHLQMDAFENTLNMAPDFMDGHQHIHHMPVIRQALLEVYEERFKEKKPFIRWVSGKPFFHPIKDFLLKSIICMSGANTLKKSLLKKNIPHNTSFSGIYVFKGASHFRDHFLRFIEIIEPDGLIMCHPGMVKNQFPDPIGFIREEEFAYFSSDEYLEDCKSYGISLVSCHPERSEGSLPATEC